MGLKEGDEVFITLERTDGVQANAFRGAAVLRELEKGYIMRCDEINTRIALDPMNIIKQEERGDGSIVMSLLEPSDYLPKDTWTATCPDILLFINRYTWSIDDVSMQEMNLHTRAWNAIVRDAKKELGDDCASLLDVTDMVHELNDIGWIYNAAEDKGVYDAKRLSRSATA